MASTMQMFVTAFNRAPTPQESTWLVRWDGALQSGSMSMDDVANIMNISPEVKHNATLKSTADTQHPMLPPDQTKQEVEVSNLTELQAAIRDVYQREADIPTLHWMLRELESSENGKNIAQLLAERAAMEGANSNDAALLESKTQSAIEYLVNSGWSGQTRDGGTSSVAVQRADVVDAEAEPLESTLFNEQRWEFFTSVRDTIAEQGEIHQQAMSVDQMHLLEPLHAEGKMTYDISDNFEQLLEAPEWMGESSEGYALADDASHFEDIALADRLSEGELALLDGAANRDSFQYRLKDSLDAFAQAEEGALEGIDAYRLSDANDSLTDIPVTERLSAEERAVLDGADNADAYEYRLQDTLAAFSQAAAQAEEEEGPGVFDNVDTYRLSDAAGQFEGVSVDALSEAEMTLLNEAANRDDYQFTVSDSLEALLDAPAHVTSNMASYRITDDPSDYAGMALDDQLSGEALELFLNAENREDFTYVVQDSLENLESQGVPESADGYTLTDDPSAVEGLAVSEVSDTMLGLLEGADNAADYDLVLADTLENLATAPDNVMEAATAYRLTDEDGALSGLSVTEHNARYDTFQGAENAGDYTYGINDSASAIYSAIHEDGVDFSTVDALVHQGAQSNDAQGVTGVQDTFEITATGNARIYDFEAGAGQHDRIDISAYLPPEWDRDPGETLSFDYVDTLPASVDIDAAADIFALSESLLPADAESMEDAIAEMLVISRTPDGGGGDDIVERLQIANDEVPIFDELTNRKVFAVAEDNAEGGVTTLWLWEEESSSDAFDGQVQASELTQLPTLVGVSDTDLATSFTSDYFI